jgi:hypothetical protein
LSLRVVFLLPITIAISVASGIITMVGGGSIAVVGSIVFQLAQRPKAHASQYCFAFFLFHFGIDQPSPAYSESSGTIIIISSCSSSINFIGIDKGAGRRKEEGGGNGKSDGATTLACGWCFVASSRNWKDCIVLLVGIGVVHVDDDDVLVVSNKLPKELFLLLESLQQHW